MLHNSTPLYDRLLAQISALPVIDCHEHMAGPDYMDHWREPIIALTAGYLPGELASAGMDAATSRIVMDPEVPTATKWPLFKPLWDRIQHTAYGYVSKLVMRDVYGENEMTLDALRRVGERLAERDEAFYWRVLDEAKIRAILLDALNWQPDEFGRYLDGKKKFPERMRLMIPLRLFHVIPSPARDEPSVSTFQAIQNVGMWANRDITSLDEFLEAMFVVLQRCKERGAVGIKDQSAYNRPIDYQVVPRYEAEKIFNRMLADPRTIFGWPEARPLDDFLFHQYMRFARDLHLPVQLHTGHMAGNYNRVDKANAGLLAPVLELHRQVNFDLFHGNWPYLGDLLFLAKNYPNVAIDACWTYIIDPLYGIEMLKRAATVIPGNKLHGFGGDHVDTPEYSVAHLKIARSAIASALADVVDMGWLGEQDALSMAADWLYNNPNCFFNLGLPPLSAGKETVSDTVHSPADRGPQDE